MPGRYYSDRLAAENLRRCYDLAPPRVERYLKAEIGHVLGFVEPGDFVLELGCGYGRVLGEIAAGAGGAVGIDTSPGSLRLAAEDLGGRANIGLARMDAEALGFGEGMFNVVCCVQNGVSAFGANRRRLIEEALRVTRPGGVVLFSSYAEEFWPHRLGWFRLQAEAGLLGEIDEERTGDGVIVCKDGFRADTVGEGEFRELTGGLGADVRLTVVDSSSLFCELTRTRG
jgi:SAM-dependent methyltransferase